MSDVPLESQIIILVFLDPLRQSPRAVISILIHNFHKNHPADSWMQGLASSNEKTKVDVNIDTK